MIDYALVEWIEMLRQDWRAFPSIKRVALKHARAWPAKPRLATKLEPSAERWAAPALYAANELTKRGISFNQALYAVLRTVTDMAYGG